MMSRILCNLLVLSAFLILILSAFALNKGILRKAQLASMKVGGTQLTIETAKTPLQIEKGLGGRSTLKSDGMLFYMPQATKPRFWMKGMQFPLDFVWINSGKVVDLTERVPDAPLNTPDAELKTYSPKSEVTHVLEVSSGFIKEHKIKVGDVVELP